MSDLSSKHCQPCKSDTKPFDTAQTENLLAEISDWSANNNSIEREFHFKNYYQTMAFVNAVAWLAHQEDHHPDMTVSYNRCLVSFSTHAIGGLSENDFICAARVNMLLNNPA